MLRLRSLLAIMEGVAEPETEEADHQSPETKEVEVGRVLTHLLVGTVPPEPIVLEKHRPGLLTPIAERTDGEAVESDPGSILRNAKPPPENDIPDEQKIFFTFRAQLTYGLKKGTKIHLLDLFRQWVEISYSQIPDFALLPFDDELGQAIHTPDQVPENNSTFYKEYYHNHRVLQHGNLTGMIHFRCNVSWN